MKKFWAKFLPPAWKVCSWIWLVLIIAVGVAFLANLLSAKSPEVKSFVLFQDVWRWFTISYPINILIGIMCFMFILLTIISGLYVLKNGNSQSQQLRETVEMIIRAHDNTINNLIQGYDGDLHNITDAMATTLELYEKNLQQLSQDNNNAAHTYENIFLTISQNLQTLQEQVLLAPVHKVTSDIAVLSDRLKNLEDLPDQLTQERKQREILKETLADLSQQIQHTTQMLSTLTPNTPCNTPCDEPEIIQ